MIAVVSGMTVAAARVILAGATAGNRCGRAALPEPAGASQRKRSFAVRGGVWASARASHDEPLPNAANVASRD